MAPRPPIDVPSTFVLAVLAGALVGLAGAVVLEAVVLALARGVDVRTALAEVGRDPGALALAQGVGLGLPIVVASRLRGLSTRDFVAEAFADVPISRVLAAALAGAALQIPMAELGNIVSDAFPGFARTPEEEEALRQLTRMNTLLRGLTVPLSLVVVAPLTEELLFRAFAQRALVDRLGRALGIGATSGLFTAFHGDLVAAPSIAIAGVLLGVLAERWRSIRASLAMHAGVNAVPLVVSDAWVVIPGFNDASRNAHVSPALVATSATVAAAAYVLALGPERGEPDESLGTAPRSR